MTDAIVTVEPGPVSVVTVAGEKGISGKSAYQVAVDNGFVGTEAEWLASIDGAAAITAHVAASDPHSQYLTSAEGDSAYDAAGTASTAVAAHASSVGAHNISGVASLQTALDSKIANIVEDVTPQLGGNLDVNGHKIVSVSNGNIEVAPNGAGDFFVNTNQLYVDSSAGCVGIGSATPYGKFTVKGSSYDFCVRSDGRIGDGSGITSVPSAGALRTQYAGSIFFFDVGLAYFRDGNGANSGAGLRIAAGISVGAAYVSTPPPGNGMLVQGNTGIGISSPDTILDINGALTVRGMSSTPSDPDNGSCVLWMESATGDIKMKITSGAVTKTVTLVDFSAV